MEQDIEKPKRRKRVVAMRKGRDYTGKAVLLLFAGNMLPVVGLVLCIYYLWEGFSLQYRSGTKQHGLIWLVLVSIVVGMVQLVIFLPLLGLLLR